jgi:hypothetical protein
MLTETDEVAVDLAYLLEAERIASLENDLLVFKTLELRVGCGNDGLNAYLHYLI